MSDDLRTRIAAALYDHWWHITLTLKEPPLWEKLSESAREYWLIQADAVVRELGLQPDEEMDVAPDGSPRFYRRYVTEWEIK